MNIYIGADHRGFKLKEKLKELLVGTYSVIDCGNTILDPHDDYPDFASTVALQVAEEGEDARGIVLCGSGIGVCIVANKVHQNVRCGIGFTPKQIVHARQTDNMNILAIPADYMDEKTSMDLVKSFLETSFSNDPRHVRRIEKITKMIS